VAQGVPVVHGGDSPMISAMTVVAIFWTVPFSW
jgi:hypothetical protein